MQLWKVLEEPEYLKGISEEKRRESLEKGTKEERGSLKRER